MSCDAFCCSHTALPRVKGMHQPRDSAVFFSKQTATAAARNQYTSIQRASTDGEGRREGGWQQFTFCPPPAPPACAPSLSGVPPHCELVNHFSAKRGGQRVDTSYVHDRNARKLDLDYETNFFWYGCYENVPNSKSYVSRKKKRYSTS